MKILPPFFCAEDKDKCEDNDLVKDMVKIEKDPLLAKVGVGVTTTTKPSSLSLLEELAFPCEA